MDRAGESNSINKHLDEYLQKRCYNVREKNYEKPHTEERSLNMSRLKNYKPHFLQEDMKFTILDQ